MAEETIMDSDRWRSNGTELDITGMKYPGGTAELLKAISRARTRHQITTLTVSGVPVAWITPPGPEPLPPVMKATAAAMDEAARNA